MKLIERTNNSPEEDKVILEYFELTPEFLDIKNYILDNKQIFVVYDKEKNLVKLKIKDILYFEAVGELVFAYTEIGVYEVKMRLYQVEEQLEQHQILRASKSFLINLYRIAAVTPALNGRLIATMDNGEKVMISRQYAKIITERFLKGLV
ncbi:MAG: LytTR family transcriptional regulator [Oscillospiraceae bacterium]|nr:LytTR family transcriptional regulator [Oscillospiraceae bacterium]